MGYILAPVPVTTIFLFLLFPFFVPFPEDFSVKWN